ncbi:MAG TPA: tetratricopeptide repeat protein [Dongiaceae bacterium]|jgi:predicted O-linked N-acetylglucosamine transferase (SPINDLY family)|nr:tetratricopeptide repeat protein [Dongiaceae bacterium]
MAKVDSGQSDQALADARRLTEQSPQDPAAWRALGYVQTGRKAFKEAEQALLHAISLAPKDAVSWEHLGWLYRRSGDFARSVSALRESLAIDGGKARPRMMLANSLADMGKAKKAIAEYQRVLEQEPDHVRAHNNLANLLAEKGHLKSAADHYVRAAELSEELTYRISAAHTARRIGDWATVERLEGNLLQSLRANRRPLDRAQPFPLLAMPGATAADQLAASRQMARAHAGVEAAPCKAPAILAARRRLRIGYVSSDLHNHATTYLLVEALELHDRERFEIVGFDHSVDHRGAYRDRILKAFDRVVPIAGLSDAEAARRIAAEDIAIAIDLKGWTTGARPQILSHRPAPVIAQWLGHPGTMGAPWIDYAIVDPIVAPRGSEAEFSEKLLRLPDCYQPNDRRRAIAPAPTRADAGLPEDGFVYCCFNQSFKINRAMFELWLDLLRATPRAVLWLKDDNRWATAAFKEQARAGGVDPARLIFGRSLPLAAHLARLTLADLALDCAPYGSHTTASDALWAGVPQIAYLADTFAARVSASLVSAIALPELIVRSPDEYRDLALRLASDRAALTQLKAKLAANRLTTPLFDSRQFVRHLEAGYQAIWQRCVAGLPPDHIDVASDG